MLIDSDKCNGCLKCHIYCPMEAIKTNKGKVYIEKEICVECGVCKRVSGCSEHAFVDEPLVWPRAIRKILSDPLTSVPDTGITGRGTEEMKTNEITNRIEHGELGFAIDVGRPNRGTRLSELEIITKLLSELNVLYESDNPVTKMMQDPQTGIFKEDVKNEIVMSAIIEFKVKYALLKEVLEVLNRAAGQVNTVFSVGIIARVDDDGSIPVIDELSLYGWDVSPNGKVNIGIGRCG